MARSYLIVLGAALALYLLSRTQQGQVIVSQAADAVGSAVRGMRLNNPLNVERGEPWQGLAATQPDPRFANFVSLPYGIRAAAKILITYRTYGVTTVDKIIDRWNPIADGQPPHYKPNVAAALGVSQKAQIDVRERATAFALLRAMMIEEVGAAALIVTDGQVHEGVTLAGVA